MVFATVNVINPDMTWTYINHEIVILVHRDPYHLGGGFKHFLVSPLKLGEDLPIWRAYFSGLKTHQPGKKRKNTHRTTLKVWCFYSLFSTVGFLALKFGSKSQVWESKPPPGYASQHPRAWLNAAEPEVWTQKRKTVSWGWPWASMFKQKKHLTYQEVGAWIFSKGNPTKQRLNLRFFTVLSHPFVSSSNNFFTHLFRNLQEAF